MAKTKSVAFERLLENEAWLRALARSLVGKNEDVDEILQDLWRSALSSPPRHGAHPRAWLRRSLRNVLAARGRRRHWNGHLESPQETVLAPGHTPDDAVANGEARRLVTQLVMELPEPFREVVIACYFEGRTPTELAKERDVPAATIRSWLHRGLAILREQLERRYGRSGSSLRAALLPILAVRPPRRLNLVFHSCAVVAVVTCAAAAWLLFSPEPDEAFTRVEVGEVDVVLPARVSEVVDRDPEFEPIEVPEESGSEPELRFRLEVVKEDEPVQSVLDASVHLAFHGHDAGTVASTVLWGEAVELIETGELDAHAETVVPVPAHGGYVLHARPRGVRNAATLRLSTTMPAHLAVHVVDSVEIELTGKRSSHCDVALILDPANSDVAQSAVRLSESAWRIDGPVALPATVQLRTAEDSWTLEISEPRASVECPGPGETRLAIVDARGEPVLGARARVVLDDGLTCVKTANQDGHVDVPMGEAGDLVVLTAPGCLRAILEGGMLSRGDRHRVTLPQLGLLGAHVDFDGATSESASTAYLGFDGIPLFRGTIDALGSLSVTEVLYTDDGAVGVLAKILGGGEALALWAIARNAEGRLARVDHVPAAAVRHGRMELVMHGSALEVLVTSTDDGEPLASAQVRFLPAPGEIAAPDLDGIIATVTTDAGGVARCPQVPVGRWVVSAGAHDHVPCMTAVTVSGPESAYAELALSSTPVLAQGRRE